MMGGGHTHSYCQRSSKAALMMPGGLQRQVTNLRDGSISVLPNFLPLFAGYQPCLELTGPDFQSVFNLNLWAANARLINYYMIYGYIMFEFRLNIMLTALNRGTSWGAIPFHGVYSKISVPAQLTITHF